MEGKKIFGSDNTKHSMMDLVGSAVLPRDFSNLDLYDIENSDFFFKKDTTYYANTKVIYYVPKVGKPYEAPANYGWYVSKHDVEPGDFNPEDWKQVSIFNVNDNYPIQNLEYVNRIHMMHAMTQMMNMSTKVTNLNTTNELVLSDFDDMPDNLFGMEIPFFEGTSYIVPIIDIALVDFKGGLVNDFVNSYRVKIGYDLEPDGTYAAIYEYTVAFGTVFTKKTINKTPVGDGKLHLIGIDPIRSNTQATQYVVFGVYTGTK